MTEGLMSAAAIDIGTGEMVTSTDTGTETEEAEKDRETEKEKRWRGTAGAMTEGVKNADSVDMQAVFIDMDLVGKAGAATKAAIGVVDAADGEARTTGKTKEIDVAEAGPVEGKGRFFDSWKQLAVPQETGQAGVLHETSLCRRSHEVAVLFRRSLGQRSRSESKLRRSVSESETEK